MRQKKLLSIYLSGHVLKSLHVISAHIFVLQLHVPLSISGKKSGNLVLHNKMKVIAIWQLTSPSFYLHVFTYYPDSRCPKSLHLGN